MINNILCVLKNTGEQDDKLYIVYCRTRLGKMINYIIIVCTLEHGWAR